jgi:cellulose synthase/poly-beta-1,6-N-acetylglucosamine synthase-like glycosyltransferase
VRPDGLSSRAANTPPVSILIPAWREYGTIEACIAALQAVDYPQWEAIIIAGGDDGTYQAARNACRDVQHFRVIEQPPRGKNAALNAGYRLAQGEIIVLLDADSRVTPGWLRALVAPLATSNKAGARVSTGTYFPLRRTALSQAEQMEKIVHMQIAQGTGMQGSGSIALQRSVLEELGLFPEDVRVGVDWDLSVRLAALGVTGVVCHDAVLYTDRPATLYEYWRNEVRWRRAHFTSLFRHRHHFLKNVPSTFLSLYIYGLGWFSVFFSLSTGLVLLCGKAAFRFTMLRLWLLFWGWLLMRRAVLAVQVAVYTHNANWLKLIGIPPLQLLLTLFAIVPAVVTCTRQRFHFKGPRSHKDLYARD